MSQPLTSPFRLIALDLDGTLTNTDKIITLRTFETLMRAQSLGVRLVLCSGRPTHGIAALAEQLQLRDNGGFVLSCNGANIIDWTTGRLIFDQALDAACLPRLLDFAESRGLPIVTYPGDHLLATRNDSPGIKHLGAPPSMREASATKSVVSSTDIWLMRDSSSR